jgi:SAM-dependent methyltransferase
VTLRLGRRVRKFPGGELLSRLGGAVPSDHARQTLAEDFIERRAGRSEARPWRVLDLGCGEGGSVDLFRARDPEVQWVGLDVPGSPEAATRTRTDARFETFDGISMPFADASFELVYCKQVLEHVRHPEPLLAEVSRVLVPGGYFAGSTSQLEPFHSLSVWNFTPVGLAALLGDAGLSVLELRPGIDALTLIARRLVGHRPCFERWWAHQSPLNRALDLAGRGAGVDAQTLNAAKLLFCGQFAFLARSA